MVRSGLKVIAVGRREAMVTRPAPTRNIAAK